MKPTLLAARRLAAVCAVAAAIAVSPAPADSTETHERTVTKLAEGVYTIRHPDAPDTFPQGNTTVVIGTRGVLVVDSCLLPSSAREDIATIRTWTDLPVTWLVNTHWHFDHTLGNATYAAAFPAIRIVAQDATRKIVADYNPGAVARYPKRAELFRTVLDTGKKPDGTAITAAERRDYERALAGLEPMLRELDGATQLVPDVSFRESLKIDLGNRPVEILFLGPGNTAGDTVVYLPKERIVATGDLVDHPVPYFFGGLPVDFARTLEKLAALDAGTFVPGHGEVLHDKAYLGQVVALLDAVNAEVEREIDDGKSERDVVEAVPGAVGVDAWRERFAGDDSIDRDFFDSSFAGLVKASYRQIKMR